MSDRRFAEAVDQVVEDRGESEPLDAEAFDLEQLGLFQDGDWPEFPAQTALDWLPEDVLALGEKTGNMINGDWIEFPQAVPLVQSQCQRSMSLCDTEREGSG